MKSLGNQIGNFYFNFKALLTADIAADTSLLRMHIDNISWATPCERKHGFSWMHSILSKPHFFL